MYMFKFPIKFFFERCPNLSTLLILSQMPKAQKQKEIDLDQLYLASVQTYFSNGSCGMLPKALQK